MSVPMHGKNASPRICWTGKILTCQCLFDDAVCFAELSQYARGLVRLVQAPRAAPRSVLVLIFLH